MRTLIIAMSIIISTFPSIARSNDDVALCVQTHLAREAKMGPALGVSPSEVEVIVSDIARRIAFQGTIKITYCENYIRTAIAWRATKKNAPIPEGEYIAINNTWLRETIGTDKFLAVALLGHELGHIYNQHFEGRQHIPRLQMETEADLSAGCAVASLGGDAKTLEDLFYKLRLKQGTSDYPSRADSLAAAKRGYANCGGNKSNDSDHKASLRVAADPDTVGIYPNGYRPVNYVFQSLNNVGFQVESEDAQWVLLDGTPISPVTRFNRILGGSFPVRANSRGIYHNNIYLPPREVSIANSRNEGIVQLRHWFNLRDDNGNVFQVPATLRIHILR